MRLWLWAWITASALAGCAGSLGLDAPLVHEGMTRSQLLAAMGPAQNIHADGDREVWQYCRRDLIILRPRGITNILLLRGAVADWRDYENDAMSHCEDFYRAFGWEEVAGTGFAPVPGSIAGP